MLQTVYFKIKQVPLLIKIGLIAGLLFTSSAIGISYADGSYTVSGVVSFGSNASPAANVSLELTNTTTGAEEQTTTNSNGNYSIANVPDGSYTVYLDDYNKGNGNPVPTSFNANPLTGSVVVDGSNLTQNLNFNTNTVAVTVLDTNGNLAPGAQVTLANIDPYGTFSDSSGDFTFKSYGGDTVSTVTTASNGVATVAVIPGMTYSVCATLSGGGQSCAANLAVNSDTTDEVDFAPSAYTVSGVVSFGSNASPAANVSLELTNESTGAEEQTTTDSNGNYSIANVPDGSYTVYLDDYNKGNGNPVPTSFSAFPQSGTVTVSGSNVTQNFAFNTNNVTVTVLDGNGNLAPGAEVTLANVDPYGTFSDSSGDFTFKSYGGNTTSTVTTDSNGTAAVSVIPGMTYTVCATLSGGGTSCAANLAVNSDTTDEVSFVSSAPSVPTNLIAPSPTNTAPALSWNGVSGATSYNIYRNGINIGNATNTTYADNSLTSDGTYSYTVTAVNTSGESSQSSPVSVVYDTTPPDVTITGVINGETYAANNTPTPVCNTTDALSGVATDASLAISNSGNSYTATCSGAKDNAGNVSSPVSVSYTLLPANYIFVNFSDSNGNALSNAKVTIENTASQITTLYTDSFGNTYLNTALGTYKVTVYYANGYVSQSITVTSNGPNNLTFSTVPVTVTINDPSSQDIASASVAQAGNTGSFGSKVPVNASGQLTFQVLPGTNSFTAYDANGYEQQTITASATNNTVTFNTDSVQVTVTDENGNPLTTATLTQAGNTGDFSSKQAVNSSGQYTFYVLPGTNYFEAFNGPNNYTKQTLDVTGNTSTTIAVN